MRAAISLISVSLVLATLTACSKQDDTPYNSAENAAPDIGSSAAPNVAFHYDYRFAVAATAIAAVQEKHAAACEALGLDRCRITGVRYSRAGEDHADGMLELALAPDIARKFGKDATAIIEASRGNLASLDIGGEDQSRTLEISAEAVNAAKMERARLEQQLQHGKLPARVRADIESQLSGQRAAEQQAQGQGRDARALIATTPMRFNYSTNGFLPGLSIDRTTMGALGFAASILNGLLALIVVLVTLAIPIGLILLAIAHGRTLAIRIWQRLAPRPIGIAVE
jgi:predicted phage tail protein